MGREGREIRSPKRKRSRQPPWGWILGGGLCGGGAASLMLAVVLLVARLRSPVAESAPAVAMPSGPPAAAPVDAAPAETHMSVAASVDERPTFLSDIAARYRIEVIAESPVFPVSTTHGEINGRSAQEDALTPYLPLFVKEFGLYPPPLIERSQLKCIVFCEGLSFVGQLRNAIPDYEHDTLYLEVRRGNHDKTYLRKVIHHEFFHIIDYRDDGLVYEDQVWSQLNPAPFHYGRGGITAQDRSDTSLLTDRYPGFLNHYSTMGVEEDKAELFANLVVDPSHIERRADADPVIDRKVTQMKELLFHFCPDMNEAFWERVEEKGVLEN